MRLYGQSADVSRTGTRAALPVYLVRAAISVGPGIREALAVFSCIAGGRWARREELLHWRTLMAT